MRTVVAHKSIGKYLEKCGLERKFSFGLVIGQPSSQNKDYIVHLAKNSDCYELEPDSDTPPEGIVEGAESLHDIESIDDLNETSFSNQIMSLIKMIPGCFFVLGIFFIDESNIADNDKTINKIIGMFQEMERIFRSNKFLCGNSPILADSKMIMMYNSSTKTTNCKYYDLKTKLFNSAENVVFIEKQFDWILFETNYELDEVLPLIEKDKKFNIESHFNITLEAIHNLIEESMIFVQNELVEDIITLENYIKKLQNKNEKIKQFPVSVFLKAKTGTEEQNSIQECDGLVRYAGIVASRIWVQPKTTFKEIYHYIKTDILRSLASRLQIYCDGLVDPYASDENVVINEPPRRVFYEKPDSNGLEFCDYIFRGEAVSVVVAQAKYILDLEIESNKVNDMIEGFTDDDSFGMNKTINTKKVIEKNKFKVKEYKQVIYVAGLTMAIFVLIISIIFHFFLR